MTPTSDTDQAQSTWLARTAVGVSMAVHVAAVTLSLGYAGAGLFASEPEAVPVEVISQQNVATMPENKPDERQADTSQLDLRPALDNVKPQDRQTQQAPAAAPPPSAAAVQPAARQPATQTQARPQQSLQPSYSPPPPDISLQYQVDFGLKPLSTAAAPQAESPRGGTSEFDEAATSKANIERASIAAFRAHLKECAPLPSTIGPTDKVVIVLRATFTPDAKLAAVPILIEASASAKGPLLMQAAIAALQSCQPYHDLPADKYAEWRVLDLRFTPQDFRQG